MLSYVNYILCCAV